MPFLPQPSRGFSAQDNSFPRPTAIGKPLHLKVFLELMLWALAVALPSTHHHTNTQRLTPAPNASLCKFKHRLSASAQTGITTLKKKYTQQRKILPDKPVL